MMNTTTDRIAAMARRLGGVVDRIGAIAVPVIVVGVLSLFATCGYLARRIPNDVDFPMLHHEAADHPLPTVLFFLGAVVVYTAIIIAMVLGFGYALRRTGDAVVAGATTAGSVVRWLFARWWRVSLLLLVAWSPMFVLQWPGTSNPDLVMQGKEVLFPREASTTPPYDVYPTGHYLVPEADDVMLTNHHNAFLTLFYGNTLGLSIRLFDQAEPGFWFLTTSQALFTLVAFGRSTTLLARWVHNTGFLIAAAVVLVVGGYPLALWSMSIVKNPAFAAAFIWSVALAVDHVRSTDPPRWPRVAEWFVVTLIAVASAKFAGPIMMVLFILVALSRFGWRAWRTALIAVGLPVLLLQTGLRIGTANEWIIPGDSLAGKGLQIQSMAVTMSTRPNALEPADAEQLDKIFNLERVPELYRVHGMGLLRGAGYREGAYRWRTVTAEEVGQFDSLWLKMARNAPYTTANGALINAYGFFDPLRSGRANVPSIRSDNNVGTLVLTVDGHTLSDDGVNDERREQMHAFDQAVGDHPVFGFWQEAPLRVVLVILLAVAAIALRRPSAWVWTLPLALHAGVLIMSGVDSSGRYSLGITYFLPLAILALAGTRSPVTAENDVPDQQSDQPA